MVKWLLANVERIFPGYFAFVMATGIISVATRYWGHDALSEWLFWVAAGAYIVLMAANGSRAILFPLRMREDWLDPRLCFAYFTVTAGGNVLVTHLVQHDYTLAAHVLWYVGLLSWAVIALVAFSLVATHNSRSVVDSFNGIWLIAVVATQSLVIATLDMAPWIGLSLEDLLMGTWVVWVLGICLYGLMILLVWERLLFHPVSPKELTPPYWIAMGAAAISALAGTRILEHHAAIPPAAHAGLYPFTYGMTLLLWAWANGWIPYLVILGVWRHGIHRQPLTYDPSMWGMIFPLGMYGVASYEIAQRTDWNPLYAI